MTLDTVIPACRRALVALVSLCNSRLLPTQKRCKPATHGDSYGLSRALSITSHLSLLLPLGQALAVDFSDHRVISRWNKLGLDGTYCMALTIRLTIRQPGSRQSSYGRADTRLG